MSDSGQLWAWGGSSIKISEFGTDARQKDKSMLPGSAELWAKFKGKIDDGPRPDACCGRPIDGVGTQIPRSSEPPAGAAKGPPSPGVQLGDGNRRKHPIARRGRRRNARESWAGDTHRWKLLVARFLLLSHLSQETNLTCKLPEVRVARPTMCLGTQGPRSWRSVENLKTGPESSLANAPFQSPFASPTERLPHSTQSELPRLRVPGPDTSVSPRSSRHSKQQSLEHCALAAPWHGDPCPEKSRGHVRAADDGKRKTKNSTIPKVETEDPIASTNLTRTRASSDLAKAKQASNPPVFRETSEHTPSRDDDQRLSHTAPDSRSRSRL